MTNESKKTLQEKGQEIALAILKIEESASFGAACKAAAAVQAVIPERSETFYQEVTDHAINQFKRQDNKKIYTTVGHQEAIAQGYQTAIDAVHETIHDARVAWVEVELDDSIARIVQAKIVQELNGDGLQVEASYDESNATLTIEILSLRKYDFTETGSADTITSHAIEYFCEANGFIEEDIEEIRSLGIKRTYYGKPGRILRTR